MIYFLIYLWIGVIATGMYHAASRNLRSPVKPRTIDYFLITFFWPIPISIALFIIITALIRGDLP